MLIESFMIRYARKEWVDVATLSFEAEFVESKEIIQDISSIYLKGKQLCTILISLEFVKCL